MFIHKIDLPNVPLKLINSCNGLVKEDWNANMRLLLNSLDLTVPLLGTSSAKVTEDKKVLPTVLELWSTRSSASTLTIWDAISRRFCLIVIGDTATSTSNYLQYHYLYISTYCD
ncbi:hypothetical protein LguiB_027871 [Lonicera macranthoides]